MAKVDFSLILACYNEGPTFENNVRRIIKVLQSLKQNWEIIFVEDKSNDKTKKKIEKLTNLIKNSKAIYHRSNKGRGQSVADGIKVARGLICGYCDVDGEISAHYIPVFIEEIEKGYDLVVAKRFYEGELSSFTRFIASKTYAQLVKMLLKIPIEDTEAGYKFFRRSKILPVLAKVKNKRWFWDTGICAQAFWSNLKISQIPVLYVRRADKKSTVRLLPDSYDYLVSLIKLKFQIPKSKS